MDLSQLGFTSALDLAASIRTKEISPVEVVDGILDRVERLNPTLNAFSEVLADDARAAARAAEAAVQRGDDLGPLHGVPVGVKDQMNVTGARVTFGTHLLADYVATEDAPVVAGLRRAGAIIVGMTTMPEFGWQGISWSPLYGMTRNPWDLERSTAGSSAGSGAAVAAGMVPLAVGSDGAGSIRMPASFCGIVGLKPTYGRVAMYPVSVSELVTHYGPMSRTVRDTAAMLQAIAGPDPRDPHCLPASDEDYLAVLRGRRRRACGSPTALTSATRRSTPRWQASSRTPSSGSPSLAPPSSRRTRASPTRSGPPISTSGPAPPTGRTRASPRCATRWTRASSRPSR